jgi:hypothetical protein
MSAAARLEPVAFSISRLAAFTSAEEVSKQTVLPLITARDSMPSSMHQVTVAKILKDFPAAKNHGFMPSIRRAARAWEERAAQWGEDPGKPHNCISKLRGLPR